MVINMLFNSFVDCSIVRSIPSVIMRIFMNVFLPERTAEAVAYEKRVFPVVIN